MLSLTPWTASASRWIGGAQARQDTALARLASGRRLNGAADDAAGSAIAERLAAQLNGLRIARQGAWDGLSLAETADGALGQATANLQRMRELALQARNGTLNASDRASLDTEYQALAQEVNRVAGGTTFNGQHILAAEAGAHTINTGPGADDTLTLDTPDLRSDAALADATSASLATAQGAAAGLGAIDDALESLGQHRARLGASQARLQAAADTATLRHESSARSHARLVDTDVAATTSHWRQAQVQQYAAIALLRQQNQHALTGGLLSLFG